MSATDAAVSKETKLANSIADTVIAKVTPILSKESEAQVDRFAELMTRLGAIEARLEVLEGMGSGAKKATKTSAGKSGAAAKGGKTGTKKVAEDPRDKVKNSMLYFRWAYANDEEFHNAYITDDITAALEADDNLAKKKDPTERLLAEATLIWKSHLDKPQKDEIRTLYNEWVKQREKEGMDEQLDENGTEEADA
jgi:hypothetical protein